MDWLSVVRSAACILVLSQCLMKSLHAQQFSSGQGTNNRQAAQSRMRPLGSASAVDSFAPQQLAGGAGNSSLRQVTVMQIPVDSQPMAPPSLPPGGFAFPNTAQPLPNNIGPASPPSGFAFPSNGLPAPLQSTSPAGPIALPPSPQPQPAQPQFIQPAPPPNVPLPLNQGAMNTAPAPVAPRVVPSQGLPINPNVSPQPRPSSSAPLVVGPGSVVPRMSAPPNGMPGGMGPAAVNPPSASDYAAIPQPQLDNAFATMDNCRNVTGPSPYRAAGFFGCNQPASYTSPVYGPPVYGAPTTYVPPPSQVAPAVALPAGATYSPVSMAGSVPPVLPGSPGYRPLFTLGQERNPVQVGQGFWGQPVAYVPGQTIRNGLRYISF
jgi:hypothetical protein